VEKKKKIFVGVFLIKALVSAVNKKKGGDKENAQNSAGFESE